MLCETSFPAFLYLQQIIAGRRVLSKLYRDIYRVGEELKTKCSVEGISWVEVEESCRVPPVVVCSQTTLVKF